MHRPGRWLNSARKARKASRIGDNNGWRRRLIPTLRARAIVSPSGRGTVSAGADRARFHPERTAPGANAAARIRRIGGLAGRERLCRAGAGTAGPWRDRRKKYLEDQGGCDDANYSRAGYATADSIKAALGFLLRQDFIQQGGAVVVGHSAGGWGALALASEDPKAIAAIIVFAPGRGGHANDAPGQVCAPQALVASAGEFGEDARVPVTWLVAANDSYFSPDLSKQMADAFRKGGDKVDFRVLPAFGSEGHWLAETDGGEKIYGPVLESAFKPPMPKPASKK